MYNNYEMHFDDILLSSSSLLPDKMLNEDEKGVLLFHLLNNNVKYLEYVILNKFSELIEFAIKNIS